MENDERRYKEIGEIALFFQRYSPAEQEQLIAMFDELFANRELLIHEDNPLFEPFDILTKYLGGQIDHLPVV